MTVNSQESNIDKSYGRDNFSYLQNKRFMGMYTESSEMKGIRRSTGNTKAKGKGKCEDTNSNKPQCVFL